MGTSRLYLVRHGETTGESRIRLNGATDVALSEHGQAQMRAVRDHLMPTSVDLAVSSPLVRSHESATIIRGTKAYDIDVIDGFREIDFGDWETWTFAEVAERDPDGYRRYQEAVGDFQFPSGDTRSGFRDRISHAALSTLDTGEGTMVAALHKGVIKVVTAALLREPADDYAHQPCDLGSITILERTGCKWRLLKANQVDHLGGLHLSD
jgi:broad specificity phosphatase PhoE